MSTERTILIVDDDVDFVEAISALLEVNGFTVLRAYDRREGLRLAKTGRPDLIIMDITTSERTEGSFAVQEIRKTMELVEIPIFVVSSLYSGEEDFRTSPDSAWLTHDEFFSKPLNTLQLLEKIRQRLKNGGQARRATVQRQA
jgi:two-component system alkaline phosphatase synthesis response regulator PhoP